MIDYRGEVELKVCYYPPPPPKCYRPFYRAGLLFYIMLTDVICLCFVIFNIRTCISDPILDPIAYTCISPVD